MLHHIGSGHQHAGSAKTTLKRVMFKESLLEIRQHTLTRQALDRIDRPAISLHRQHKAAPHDLTI